MIHRTPLLCLLGLLLVVGIVGQTAPAWANVYASGLNKTGDKSFSYILNEAAGTGVDVQVWQVGGGMVYSESLGAQAKGAQSWTWNGTGAVIGNSYKIKVVASDAGHAAWSQITPDSASNNFFLPQGISVNQIQGTANFGRIYVSEAQGGATGAGRSTTSGIYMLNADGSEAGYATGGRDWVAAGNSAPYKSCIGEDGHLYVADLSNDLAFEFSEDMSTVTQLIDASNKTANQWVGGILVTGTGADRMLYLVDTNYNDTLRKGVIGYSLGTAASVAAGDTGTQVIPKSYFTYYPNDVAQDSEGNWYVCQTRYDPAQAPAISKFLDGVLPLATPVWETAKVAPYNGAYGMDICEAKGWAAYGNYYDGFVRIFSMVDGSYIGGFDAGSRLRDIAFDAAGNVITADTSGERVRIWSPGDGANSFTTESWFAFDVVPEPSSLMALLVGVPGMLLIRRRKR